mmetsp:Transcript_1257/g.4704  ORF Transcript_1257/g.4704 Transcript_1257/m.4704 type:complete len:305 (+) Transcript_1257:3-917(+)
MTATEATKARTRPSREASEKTPLRCLVYTRPNPVLIPKIILIHRRRRSLVEKVREPVQALLQPRPVERVRRHDLPRVRLDLVQRQTLRHVHRRQRRGQIHLVRKHQKRLSQELGGFEHGVELILRDAQAELVRAVHHEHHRGRLPEVALPEVPVPARAGHVEDGERQRTFAEFVDGEAHGWGHLLGHAPLGHLPALQLHALDDAGLTAVVQTDDEDVHLVTRRDGGRGSGGERMTNALDSAFVPRGWRGRRFGSVRGRPSPARGARLDTAVRVRTFVFLLPMRPKNHEKYPMARRLRCDASLGA